MWRGEFADFFSINNSVEIYELQRQQAIQMRLAEFHERAELLSRETGVVPIGFFAFEKAHPTPRERSTWAPLALSIVGGLIGFLAGPIGMAIGAAIGFGVGMFTTEPESQRLGKAMDKYDAYLTQTEIVAHSQSRAMAPTMGGVQVRMDHAQRLAADRAQADLAQQPVAGRA